MGGKSSKSQYTLEQPSQPDPVRTSKAATEPEPTTAPAPAKAKAEPEPEPVQEPDTSNATTSKASPKVAAKSATEEPKVEAVVCKVDEMKDGEMKEVEVDGSKALLIKEAGDFHAIGPKCTHYGAPLVKGSLCNGKVRCPWHGACFNIKTGDIEDFPGLDSVQKFDVEVNDGNVKIRATKQSLEQSKRIKKMTPADASDKRTFLIVGGGGASVTCAETLRQEGFQGKIIIATKETCLPYDRPKLSKALNSKPEDIALRQKDFFAENSIEIQLEKEATKVEPDANKVTFKDGSSIQYDKLMLATGGSPRSLQLPGVELENVCLLRTPKDANSIAEKAAGKNVVIIGTSFIGMEVSSCLAEGAKSITMLDILEVPFQHILGEAVGRGLKKMHEEKGTKFIAKNSPKELVGENGKLTEVVLSDDTRLPADLCIMGIGVFPTTAFLKDSGIEMDERGFVKVDKMMQTNKTNIFAAGDIVTFPLFSHGDVQGNVQHWQMAHAHGHNAAKNMLDQKVEIKSVPYFWTVQFGKSLRYTGYGMGFDDIVLHGDPQELKFVAFYTKGDDVVSVASMNWDPIVSQAADFMLSGKKITKAEIKDDPCAWLKRA